MVHPADEHEAWHRKPLKPVLIEPPPPGQRVSRPRSFQDGEKKSRYSLPRRLRSGSPVGYRTRVSMTEEEAAAVLPLLSLSTPHAFEATSPPTEAELFEECSLGVLSARQSTNFRGHREYVLDAEGSRQAAAILARMSDLEGPVLPGAAYTHVVFSRPYRTPFTLLLTFVGHRPITSLATVPIRALRKRSRDVADIPTIAYLSDLHVGVLAEAMERAAVIASQGRRRTQIFMRPFSGEAGTRNVALSRELARVCGLAPSEWSRGWRVALVASVGGATAEDRIDLPAPLWRKLGANLMAFRSERVQPGVSTDERAPSQYATRQSMDLSPEFDEQVGRAAYNAFARWTGLPRSAGKSLLLLDRLDVLTPDGKERLRAIRRDLNTVTDRVIAGLPKWIDLPSGKLLSRNAERGRKAFALAGQRIYLVGLSRSEVANAGMDWHHAIRCVGAMAARGTLYAELMGTTCVPEGCDLLAGCCLMAGPVNQNDVGKTFFGMQDLLAERFGARDPTSLLVWTLKAKTIADPIGNEEQLMDAERKGALVDLRPAPHEVIAIRSQGRTTPMRVRDGRVNQERAFGDVGNFVVSHEGEAIEGNAGEPWPVDWRSRPAF